MEYRRLLVVGNVDDLKDLLRGRDGFIPWRQSDGIEELQHRRRPSLDNHDANLFEESRKITEDIEVNRDSLTERKI